MRENLGHFMAQLQRDGFFRELLPTYGEQNPIHCFTQIKAKEQHLEIQGDTTRFPFFEWFIVLNQR